MTARPRYKWVAALLLVFFLIAAGFSGWRLYEAEREYRAGADAYVEIARFAPAPQEAKEADMIAIGLGGAEEREAPALPAVDFSALQGINEDFTAWLYIPGTGISYPVAQGEDNAYYLEHLFDDTKNSAGCLFLDCRNAPGLDDRHSIIYGHNMKNGAMFAALTEYSEQAFYEAHPSAYLMTPERTYEICFFAGYTAADSESAWALDFADGAAFEAWCEAAAARSCFYSGVNPASGDRVVTLSTCAYAFDDARFVLHGWLKEV